MPITFTSNPLAAILTWTIPASAAPFGFEVERSRDGVTWKTLGRVPSTVFTFTDDTINPLEAYTWRVRALYGDSPSNSVAVTTPDGVQATVSPSPFGTISPPADVLVDYAGRFFRLTDGLLMLFQGWTGVVKIATDVTSIFAFVTDGYWLQFDSTALDAAGQLGAWRRLLATDPAVIPTTGVTPFYTGFAPPDPSVTDADGVVWTLTTAGLPPGTTLLSTDTDGVLVAFSAAWYRWNGTSFDPTGFTDPSVVPPAPVV